MFSNLWKVIADISRLLFALLESINVFGLIPKTSDELIAHNDMNEKKFSTVTENILY